MKIDVFIGGERSGKIRNEFLKLGFSAISCDYQESQSPGPHIKGNMFEEVLKFQPKLLIMHPDCRYLAFSGEQWIKNNPERMEKRIQAFKDFMFCFQLPGKMKLIENSFSQFINKNFRKPDFSLQPWQFGESFQKRTDFWTENLPPLIPEMIVSPGKFHITPSGKKLPAWYGNNKKERDITFSGIARAIANQYRSLL